MEKVDEIYSFLRIVCSLSDNGPNNFATASLRLMPYSDGQYHLQGQVILEVISGNNGHKFIEILRKEACKHFSAQDGETGRAYIYELADKRTKDIIEKITGAISLHPCLYQPENYHGAGQSCIVDFDFGVTDHSDFQKCKAALRRHIHRDFPRVKVAVSPESFHLT